MLTDISKGEYPIASFIQDPFFGLVKKLFCFAALSQDIVLKAINGIFQNRQDEPFLGL